MKKTSIISVFMCCAMLCACGNKDNTEEKQVIQSETEAETTEVVTEYVDMSVADSPEEMAARLIEAVGTFDRNSYIDCYPDAGWNDTYDDITQDFYNHFRSEGLDYKKERPLGDFNAYLNNDKLDEGRVSVIAFNKECNKIYLHIIMEFDISKDGYCITDVISSEAGSGGNESYCIERGYKLIDFTEDFNEHENS